ncbi:hypothetical protein BGW38_007884 [Lunasporangiospora selenospora]|uniref:Uncharacterized protein n=1 Tax=Lunasporangiospora selenospora TaxID=979761 RepID=A0A9P6FK38_9FUNG|nr:hypothetical protein BGW38_007884 [Lunasporangiospora selenospora]
MHYKAPSPVMHYITLLGALLLLLVFAPGAAQANTEKVIFTVRHGLEQEPAPKGSEAGGSSPPQGAAEDDASSTAYHSIVDPTLWKRLRAPHTIVRNESVRPSYYKDDVTVLSARKQRNKAQDNNEINSGPDPKKGILSQLDAEDGTGVDLETREFKWYALEDLEEATSFELRISYPSTSPADFDILVWTMHEAQKQLGAERIVLSEHFPKNRFHTTIEGTSHQPLVRTSSIETPLYSAKVLPIALAFGVGVPVGISMNDVISRIKALMVVGRVGYVRSLVDLMSGMKTMFARIKATYTGVSHHSLDGSSVHAPESKLVPYNLVLEQLYFQVIPYQALKLTGVIIAIVVVGLGFLVPNLYRFLTQVADKKME